MTPYLHSHTILHVQISLPLRLTLTYTQEERGEKKIACGEARNVSNPDSL